MDEFKERRPETKKLEEGFAIEPYQHLITQVVQFLMLKALHEKRKQDKYNPTILGNVSFYVEDNKISKEMRLHFDKNPKTWNQKEIVNDMLNMEADIMMEKQANDNIADMQNPFRY